MSWITAPTEDGADGEVSRLYERDRAALGYVANYTLAFAHRPAVYDAWRGLNGAIKSSMDPQRYELATLAAALRLRSSYCSLAHGALVAETVADPAVAVALLADPETSGLDALDVAVMRLADKVAAGAADMDASDLDELRSLGLDDAAVLDVVLAAAARCFFSSVLDAVGAEPDRAYASLDPALRDALTVGRPIEAAER